jgi:hypothetical protein
MWYAFLADVLVAVHVAYVSFVVLGMLLILVGTVVKWNWVRNPWFRISHFTAIAIVALEAIFGIACPLTVWEAELRQAAGQTVAEGTFVGRLLHNLIFVEAPAWVFTVMYVAFAMLVLSSFFFAPLRWKKREMRAAYR